MDSGDDITVEMRLAAIEEKLDRLLAHLGIADDAGPGSGLGLGAGPGIDPGFGLAGALTAAGPAPSYMADAEAQIVALIQAGKKIQAIKAYRQATGVGLKAAKDAVEAWERNVQTDGGRR